MDCTHCESVLLDLCYGELAPAHEREVRAHIHECPNCRKALSRLEAGQALARHLPDEPVPPELTARIMRAAEAHARRSTGGWLERVQLVIESMARIAMTRQVAMATLSLLIVFVGLWSIPELTRRREAPSAMVVEPSAEGEAGPSRDVVPVAPEPLTQAPTAATADKPTASALKHGATRSRAASDPPALAKAERSEKMAARRRAQPSAESKASGDVRVAETAKPKKGRFAPPPPAAAPAAAVAEAEAERPQAPADDERMLRASADRRAVDNRAAAPIEEGLPESLGGAKRSGAPSVSASASASNFTATIEALFRAGVERYRADDFPAAVQLFSRMLESSAPSAQRAAALLYLARSERALGRCDRAIRAYETLVRSYGSAQQSASALTEGVACYDRLGDAAGANRLLEHAASVPSLSVQATKAREDRSAGKPAAPAAAAEPSPR